MKAATKLNDDKTAQLLTSGTLLDAIVSMGDDVHRLFVINSYIPSDMPITSGVEYAIEIIKQQGTPRIMVIAWQYNGDKIFTRSAGSNGWIGNWRSVALA